MPKRIEMAGMRFGRLTAIKQVECGKYNYKYLCKCDCGKEKVIASSALRTGLTKSCGCIKSEMLAEKNYKHGKCGTPEYRSAWARVMHMKRKLRLPKWADVEAIRNFYMNRPKGYEVDHVIPLGGKLVSGLHVLENLQYLPIADNRTKQNFYEVI